MNDPKPKIYADDVPYFQTGQSSADTWIDKAKREIASVGGKVQAEAFGADATGRSAFMLAFTIGGDPFKVTWPVLPSRTGKDKAAKIQAATALYHDVKARVVSAKFLGMRGAFLTYLVLINGQTASEMTSSEIANSMPKFMLNSGAER